MRGLLDTMGFAKNQMHFYAKRSQDFFIAFFSPTHGTEIKNAMRITLILLKDEVLGRVAKKLPLDSTNISTVAKGKVHRAVPKFYSG